MYKLWTYTERLTDMWVVVHMVASYLLSACMCWVQGNPWSCTHVALSHWFPVYVILKMVSLAHDWRLGCGLCSCSLVCLIFQILLFNMFLQKPTINKLTSLDGPEEQELPEVKTLTSIRPPFGRSGSDFGEICHWKVRKVQCNVHVMLQFATLNWHNNNNHDNHDNNNNKLCCCFFFLPVHLCWAKEHFPINYCCTRAVLPVSLSVFPPCCV